MEFERCGHLPGAAALWEVYDFLICLTKSQHITASATLILDLNLSLIGPPTLGKCNTNWTITVIHWALEEQCAL